MDIADKILLVYVCVVVLLMMTFFGRAEKQKVFENSVSETEYCLYQHKDSLVKDVPAKCLKYFQ